MIRELYCSIDILPEELRNTDSPKYIEAMAQTELIRDELYQKLPPNLKKDFKNFIELQEIVATEGREDGFVQGFRMGARLMLDI